MEVSTFHVPSAVAGAGTPENEAAGAPEDPTGAGPEGRKNKYQIP